MAGPALYNGEKKNSRSKMSKTSSDYKGGMMKGGEKMVYNGGTPGQHNMNGLEGVKAPARSKNSLSNETDKNSGTG